MLGGLENDDPTDFKTHRMASLGLDAKVAITANLSMDLSVYPDFAQVEADREQVNLTRFSLYYPLLLGVFSWEVYWISSPVSGWVRVLATLQGLGTRLADQAWVHGR